MDSLVFKRLASDAGNFFNRAKQYTEEKLGSVERTTHDAHFDSLMQRADNTRLWTEQILTQTQALLQPNPNMRIEDYFYNKLDRQPPARMTNSEQLGQYMVDAGNGFGPGTAYGSTLLKCGNVEQKLGLAERDFVQTTANNFLQPLQAFLDGDMKTVQKEKKLLDSKRLDLDVCKSRLRRARGQPDKESGPAMFSEEWIAKAEIDLQTAQSEFDRQCEITKLLLDGINSTHTHHLRCLHDFIEAQTTYYAQCQKYMADLSKQIGSFGGISKPLVTISNHDSPILNNQPSSDALFSVSTPSVTPNDRIKEERDEVDEDLGDARVLYDYSAASSKELSLKADEIITIDRRRAEEDWVKVYRGTQSGIVPGNYIQLINN